MLKLNSKWNELSFDSRVRFLWFDCSIWFQGFDVSFIKGWANSLHFIPTNIFSFTCCRTQLFRNNWAVSVWTLSYLVTWSFQNKVKLTLTFHFKFRRNEIISLKPVNIFSRLKMFQNFPSVYQNLIVKVCESVKTVKYKLQEFSWWNWRNKVT